MSRVLVKVLGMGREGCVFLVRNDDTLKIQKYLRFEISKHDLFLISEINTIDLPILFKLRAVDSNIIEYEYTKLIKIDKCKRISYVPDILKMLSVLYVDKKIGYYDLIMSRDNFMIDNLGNIRCVDYINGFTLIDSKYDKMIYRFNLINFYLSIVKKGLPINQDRINHLRKKKYISARYYFVYFILFLRLFIVRVSDVVMFRIKIVDLINLINKGVIHKNDK